MPPEEDKRRRCRLRRRRRRRSAWRLAGTGCVAVVVRPGGWALAAALLSEACCGSGKGGGRPLQGQGAPPLPRRGPPREGGAKPTQPIFGRASP